MDLRRWTTGSTSPERSSTGWAPTVTKPSSATPWRPSGFRCWGAIPRVDGIEVPSRHLGLVTAAEGGAEARAAVAMMADLVEKHVDLGAVVALADVRPGFEPWDPTAAIGGEAAHGDGPRIALAGGPAFTFAYVEHSELLTAAGARVEVFDPLINDLPDADGLDVPGGSPEEHAADLTARDAGWTRAWGWRGWGGEAVTEGFVSPNGRVHASYLHVHPAGAPSVLRSFVDACR